MFTTFETNQLNGRALYKLLVGGVSPRPIALVSTIDRNNIKNLSPFSFFNVFSINPPTLIFSPVLSSKTGKAKDTLNNILETKEVVINVVNKAIVDQASISSAAFHKDVDEFVKSNLTPIPSESVKPYRVKESPVNFECKVGQVIPIGKGGGSGNLVLARVLKLHVNNNVLTKDGTIDQLKLNTVGRMGDDWYNLCDINSMFEIEKPVSKPVIGYDMLPKTITSLAWLSKQDLNTLACCESFPSKEHVASYKQSHQKLPEKSIIELLKNMEGQNALLQLLAFYN